MSRDFEWHFGDELPGQEPEGNRRRGPWRRWLIWLLALLVAGGGVYVWWRQRQRRLDQAESQVQQVARLELRALAEGDTELYLSLQDRVDRAWLEAQAASIATTALPLPIQGVTRTETSVRSARVVGDRARVQIEHVGMMPAGTTAVFRATRFYRFTDRGQWVHTKADPGYGGAPVRFVGDHLVVSAFQEDADWLEPLVPGLQALASDYCDLSSCRFGLPVELDLGAPLGEAAEAGEAALPAPYLIGAPKNEAARQAWAASLEEFLLSRLITLQIGSRSPNVHAAPIFRDRLHAWFGAKLEVTEVSSPDLELVRGALDAGTWIPLWELWSLPSDHPRRSLVEAEVDLLLFYIEDEYGVPVVARLPRALQNADHPGEAISSVVRDPWWLFKRRYLAYVREETAERTDKLTAFQSYDLIVRCRETVASTSFQDVWGLRLGELGGTLLVAESGSRDLLPISWSPDGTRLLAVRQEDDDLTFYILEAGHPEPRLLSMMPDGAEPVGSALVGDTGWSPDGTYLAYRVPGQPVAGGIVNLRTGDQAHFDGEFVGWSPDGSHLIYGQPIPWHWSPEVKVRTFWVWDRETGHARRLGQGYAAAWAADGGRIAYVTPEPALRAYHALSDETTILLDQASLRQTLNFTPTLSPISGQPFEVDWSPTGVFIALGATRTKARGSEEGLTMLFGWGDHSIIGRQAGGVIDLAWSPDGRWLSTFTFDPEQFRTIVRGIEGEILFEGKEASLAWSPRGRYLAVGEEMPVLRVLEIETGQWREVRLRGECGVVLWNPLVASRNPPEATSQPLAPGLDDS